MAREEAIPGHCRVNWPVRQTIITVYCGQRLRPMTSQKNPSLRARQREDIIRSQEESVEEDTRVIDVITDPPTPPEMDNKLTDGTAVTVMTGMRKSDCPQYNNVYGCDYADQ